MSASRGVWHVLKFGLAGVVGLNTVADSRFDVKGHFALLFNAVLGIKEQVYPEGKHFKLPWIDQPVYYDVKSHPHHARTLFKCTDGCMVVLSVYVNAHALPDKILPISSCYGQTHKFLSEVKQDLAERLSKLDIGMDRVLLTEIYLGEIIPPKQPAKK